MEAAAAGKEEEEEEEEEEAKAGKFKLDRGGGRGELEANQLRGRLLREEGARATEESPILPPFNYSHMCSPRISRTFY